MTHNTAKATPPPTPPSYEELLQQKYSPAIIADERSYVAQTPGLGDPQSGLGVGDLAPDFALADETGQQVALGDLLARGPLILVFYRGGWCPFCNVYLRALQLQRTRIRALGAGLVLISPQLPAAAQELTAQHGLLFPLLSDAGNRVARQYGLVFRLPAELREAYLADGTDLAEINGDPSWELPMPATFLIAPDRRIRYAFVSADYTRRAEPDEVLAALQRLRRERP